MDYEKWKSARQLTEETLLSTASSFMGVPYFWGGNSYKGVDCSGFMSQVFWINGLELPRDASLQVLEGKAVDTELNFDDLQIGDLLFFGRMKTDMADAKVVHVGMWVGNGRFIHSQGRVRISSFNADDPYFDEYNLNRFLCARRVLPGKNI